jgi:hypothetical protein
MTTRKAVLIGNNTYTYAGNLQSCIYDVDRISEILRTHGKGDPNFHTEKFEDLTNAGMMNAISELLNEKRAPDSALFYFSGHGYVNDKGGYICGTDAAKTKDEMGVPMSWLANKINTSRIPEITVILDCCHAGAFLDDSSGEYGLTTIREGVTFLAATPKNDTAAEFSGGIFSNIIYDGLCGAAADILGHVTAVGLYNNAESLLTPGQQRPVFKSCVRKVTPLRYCLPPVKKRILREIVRSPFFEDPDDKLRLRKELLDDHSEASGTGWSRTMMLFGFEKSGLLECTDRKPLLQAIIEESECWLSPYGKHFWDLVKNNRV